MNHLPTEFSISPEVAIAGVVVCGLIACLVTVAGIVASSTKPGTPRFWGGL